MRRYAASSDAKKRQGRSSGPAFIRYAFLQCAARKRMTSLSAQKSMIARIWAGAWMKLNDA
jgi:hypothetical protein